MIQEGQQLGEYEIAGRIGVGETGAVYKARQASPDRCVAIKTIDPSLAANEEYVARFRREAEAAAALQHPNFVQVYGAGEAGGCHFVAMEFVPDESALARIKRKGRIGPENAIAIGVYLAGALDYAWKHARLVHRDIKPGNIFVSREGNVKLGAFGLTSDPGSFQPPASGADYISPEQAERKADIDLRANIYSLGCVLYHMLSGRTPYEGGDPADVMTQHASAPPPDIRTVWPACPPTLAAVIRRTMQKDPAARYQGYDELTTALRHAYDVLGSVPMTATIARPAASATAAPTVAAPVAPQPATVRPTAAPPAPAQPAAAPPPTARLMAAPSATVRPTAVPPPASRPMAAPPATVRPTAVPATTAAPVSAVRVAGPPVAGPHVTARLTAAPSAIVRPVAAPPMSVRPIAAPSSPAASAPSGLVEVAPADAVPAVEVKRSKRTLIWVAGLVSTCAAVGLLLYFAPWKKSSHDAGNAPVESPPGVPKAGRTKPFVNTLGMQFVPVRGANVLFCIWETRVKDYAGYAQAKEVSDAWSKQEYRGTAVGREPEHPVCGVSWEDANAFCHWLTEKETAEGKLKGGARYRLPTDAEWSHAAGLHHEEGSTPRERSGKINDVFPWGKEWPPPEKSGAYADAAYHEKYPKERAWIDGYNDGFPETAPGGSFAANEFGIHDLGGNVWEWCEDPYHPKSKERVLRGAAWDDSDRGYLLSSYRIHYPPGSRYSDYGFRCVIAAGAQ